MACQSESKPEAVAPVAPAPEQQTEALTPELEPKPVYTAPLTGEMQEQSDAARPLAVMINNAPAARPQSGLSEADMVYEVLAEGGITRLIAVYQSYHGDATIGPVRSIRPYLIGIGDSLHALLVHAGGSTDAYAILQGGGREHLDEITNASAPFWRDSSRKAPHNLYTNEIKLREAAAKKGYAEKVDIPAFPFLSASTGEAALPDSTNDGSDSSLTTETTKKLESTELIEPTETTGAQGTTEIERTDKAAAQSSSGSASDATASTTTSSSPDSISNRSTLSPSVSNGTLAKSNSTAQAKANGSAISTQSARQIELRFLLKSYKVGYTYNDATGLYTRQVNGKDHIDLNTNKPLTTANVIVLAGSYKVLDDIGRLSLNLNAGGQALLFQQGKVIRGEWKHDKGDAIRFYSEGQEVPLIAGTTYYNIVPDTPSFNEHLTIDGEKWD
ncbi:DUF3048 domain-containing protein [Paenibacillus wenxiniae]|uniref:DUF3048 domain-containing protein n=1 Tax=Paenibacillus wenxiniae TaxID=1636843 RepID=A0ABW4RKS5_9BACL